MCVLNLTKLGQSDASAQELHNTMPRASTVLVRYLVSLDGDASRLTRQRDS